MGVTGKSERKLRGGGGVEGMGMVGEENWECLGVAKRNQFGEGGGDGGVIVARTPTERWPAPAQTEELQGMTAHGELRGFIYQQWDSRTLHLRFKRFAALEQVVIAFDHVNAGARVEAANRVDPFRNLVERAIDQVAGHEHELGAEIV